eukprot:352891-Chlamydomonas_euryale.AAC.5
MHQQSARWTEARASCKAAQPCSWRPSRSHDRKHVLRGHPAIVTPWLRTCPAVVSPRLSHSSSPHSTPTSPYLHLPLLACPSGWDLEP